MNQITDFQEPCVLEFSDVKWVSQNLMCFIFIMGLWILANYNQFGNNIIILSDIITAQSPQPTISTVARIMPTKRVLCKI